MNNLMHNSLLIAAALAAAALTSACSSGDASSPPDSTASAPAGPSGSSGSAAPIIDNEDLGAGLAGVDADNNGIRDDIDRLIARDYSATPAIKRAAQQSARALQALMVSTTKAQALDAGDQVLRATACVADALPLKTADSQRTFFKMSHELTALTANTKERFTAYWQANALAGGAVFQQPSLPVCD